MPVFTTCFRKKLEESPQEFCPPDISGPIIVILLYIKSLYKKIKDLTTKEYINYYIYILAYIQMNVCTKCIHVFTDLSLVGMVLIHSTSFATLLIPTSLTLSNRFTAFFN